MQDNKLTANEIFDAELISSEKSFRCVFDKS